MITRKYPMLGSSADANKVSMTIKSVGVWVIPALIAIASFYGLDIAKADLVELVNVIATAVASIMTVYGLGRKLYYKYR